MHSRLAIVVQIFLLIIPNENETLRVAASVVCFHQKLLHVEHCRLAIEIVNDFLPQARPSDKREFDLLQDIPKEVTTFFKHAEPSSRCWRYRRCGRSSRFAARGKPHVGV